MCLPPPYVCPRMLLSPPLGACPHAFFRSHACSMLSHPHQCLMCARAHVLHLPFSLTYRGSVSTLGYRPSNWRAAQYQSSVLRDSLGFGCPSDASDGQTGIYFFNLPTCYLSQLIQPHIWPPPVLLSIRTSPQFSGVWQSESPLGRIFGAPSP